MLLPKKIISISILENEGFSFIIKKSCFSIYLNSMFYTNAKRSNGVYYLDIDKYILNIDNKNHRSSDSNLTYLWHCLFGHINVKSIQKLHKDELLTYFDFEPFYVCESCLMGKMRKSPFIGKGERHI